MIPLHQPIHEVRYVFFQVHFQYNMNILHIHTNIPFELDFDSENRLQK